MGRDAREWVGGGQKPQQHRCSGSQVREGGEGGRFMSALKWRQQQRNKKQKRKKINFKPIKSEALQLSARVCVRMSVRVCGYVRSVLI